MPSLEIILVYILLPQFLTMNNLIFNITRLKAAFIESHPTLRIHNQIELSIFIVY